MMTGGWEINQDIVTCSLPECVTTVFAEATSTMVGAQYLPVLYLGKQVVSGCNYMLVCKQVLSTEHADTHMVKVVIYKPASTGKPVFASVERLL
ncbi:hypothetical protein ATT74_25970 [Salmonella enterica subsp. enterica serovar Panama]|uniref:Uncharacterized protein n=1 Tax=Salmonella enterica subsp. enterica serovar Panama TaxID=29472 RepID=A0A619AIW1_SALET|nr:hypothetical protein [Salmonella enterica subsp. enterica serovar Panama]EGU5384251.1 hypothetical protein [Salmonella enterica]ECX3498299.1 hypothetical protein [Salmonella enterica subsp. enterica serovar Panama]ECX6035865.1 hypothetical protein [Salmonella enterica subsp. enterica serovar Panama]EGX1720501.1 hypothetical protein [Salmonella enterica subsp. enterica serovar Panama]